MRSSHIPHPRKPTDRALSPAAPALSSLGIAFGVGLGQHFRILSNQSRVIDRNAVLLRTVHYVPGPARPSEFNQQLPLRSIGFADSKAHPQLQAADWAAGATRR